MRSLLRAAVGVAALGALAWTVFPGVIAMVLPPGLMLARCLVIGATFSVGWVCLSMAPERSPSSREIAAASTAVLVVAVAALGYNRYQAHQDDAARIGQAHQSELAASQTKATSDDCNQSAAGSPNAKMDPGLAIWRSCGSR